MKTVNIISGKKPFTFLFLKCLDDYMSEGKECNSPFDCQSEFSSHGLNSQTYYIKYVEDWKDMPRPAFYLREDVKNLS
jgi:hypothetical protein